jgi:PAS domain S-box-containing protein
MSKVTNRSKEQKAAEAEVEGFRKDLGPFVVAAETTRMPMLFTNAKEPRNPIIFANKSFLSLTGYAREEVLGHGFDSLMARGTDPKVLAQLKSVFEGGPERISDIDPEIHYRRKDGSEFWAAIFICPVRDESSAVVQYFVSLVDHTSHKQEQAQCNMLIRELTHRVKNTLSTVQSIAWQALRSSSDLEVIRESIESRLFALSRSHDLLIRENWEGAGLLDLVKTALEPFGVGDGRSERFLIRGENVGLLPKATLALGIAFHELATNAVKYGAFSNETGLILIAWKMEPRPEGNRLVLQWREKDGPPVTPPSRKGFGSEVIERGLSHELGGTAQLDYQRDGVTCTIDLPASEVARDG